MLKRCFLISIIFVFAYLSVNALGLKDSDKRSIVRIETPEGHATGFLISDSMDSLKGAYLVTNKHVVKSRFTQEYFDSVYIRKNEIINEKVVATDVRGTLFLNYGNAQLYIEHDDPDIDLILIQVGPVIVSDNKVIDNPREFKINLRTDISAIATKEEFIKFDIMDGRHVQTVGFSFRLNQLFQYHISRFGDIALITNEKLTIPIKIQKNNCICVEQVTAEWLILDISTRSGDSGGPVFLMDLEIIMHPELEYDEAKIIGFVQGMMDGEELCLAHPSYYIWEIIEILKNR